MVKILRWLVFIFFILSGLAYNSSEFQPTDNVPVFFTVPDSLTGFPRTPDSIFFALYSDYSTTIVRAQTAMTNWNGKVGEYYYDLAVPDTVGIYIGRIDWWDYGQTNSHIIHAPLIKVVDTSLMARTVWRGLPLNFGDSSGYAGFYLKQSYDSMLAEATITDFIDSLIGTQAFWDTLALYAGGDSTIFSRWIKRLVWGIPSGSGGDSSTAAQRLVALLDNGITSAKIAESAIDSGDFGSTYWAAMQNDSAANARYIWNLPFATAWVAGSMGDSMNNSSYVQGSAVTAWNSTQRDSVLQTIADAGKLGRIIDSLNAILDSLQSQDNWVAKEATINTEVGNIDGWNPITDNDSLIGDQSTNTATAIVDTAAIGRSVWDFDIVDSTGRIVVVRPINTQGDTLARQKDSAIMQGQAAGITVAGVIDSMIKQGFVTYSLGQDSTLLLKRVAISGDNGVAGSVNIVNTSTASPIGIKVDVSSANAAGRAVQLSGSAGSYGLLAQAGNGSLYPTMAIKYADGSAGKLYSIQDSKIDSIYDTIKAANGWVATQANQQTIVINIAQNKDSIQKIRDSIDDLSPVIHAINPVSDSLFETLTVIHAALDTLGIIIPDSLNDTLTAIHNAALNAGVPDSLFDSLTAIHAGISDSDRLFSADKDLLINRITDSLNLVTIPVNVKEMEDTEYAEIAHYTGDTSWNFPFRGLTEMPQNLVRNGSFEAESLGTYLTESNIFPKGWNSYFYGTAHVIIKEVTGSNQIYSSGGKKYMEVNGDAIGDSAQFLSSPFNVKSGGYVIYGITARKGSGASITCYLHNDNDNSRLDTLNNDITSLEGITYTKIYKVPPILDDIGIEFEIFVNAETSFVYLDGTFAYYYPKLDTLDIDSISQITADLLAGGISVTCSGMGMGGVSIKVKVADTSGADAAITGAWVSLNTMAGVPYAGQLTNTSGQANFFANVNDTLVASVTIPGYVIPKSDTLPIIAGGVSDSIKGYDMITAPPGSADLCRVYLNVVDGSGNYLEGVKMTASIQNTSGGVIDTCAGTPIGQYTMGSTLSDASGYLYIDLIKSKCLNNQQKYKFIITYPSGQSFGKGPFTVPDSSTWKLTW